MSAQNPDRVLLRAFIANPRPPLPVDSLPLLQALGTSILEAESGRILLRFEPGPLFLQGANAVQGGAVSAMLDFAMAAAIMTKLDDATDFTTASLTVSFLAPARLGRLVAEGVVDRIGRRNGFARATLRGADDMILASASSVLTLIACE